MTSAVPNPGELRLRSDLQRKKPAQRLFTGPAGSPLSRVTKKVSTQGDPKPLPDSKGTVLVHFCFDQQVGEEKREWCACKMRISREDANRVVKEGRANWLIVKNARAKTGLSSFHRAIVVRRVPIAGEILFALKPPLNGRDRKHEQIKAGIRTDARKILETLFRKGVVPSPIVTMSDDELDKLFQEGPAEQFLGMLTEQNQRSLREKMIKVVLHWWQNVLGYHRLGIDTGLFIPQADQGTGEIIYEHQMKKDLTIIDDTRQTDNGHVQAANFRPSFWNRAWDYSSGTDPHDYERGVGKSKEPAAVLALKEIGIRGES